MSDVGFGYQISESKFAKLNYECIAITKLKNFI